MAIDYAALKTELQTDPQTMGYAPLIADGSDNQLAALLNALTGPGAGAVDRDILPAYEIVDAVVQAEYDPLTAAQKQQLLLITGAGQVNIRATNTRAALAAMFGPGTTTRANMLALQTRTGSRAEVLFGIGTVITADDVAIALRATP